MMMNKRIIILSFFLLCLHPQEILASPHLNLEKAYRNAWCNQHNGTIEYYIRGDYTHVDCLLDDTAVKVEFAPNFYEAIGQSLYYAPMTNRLPDNG